MSRQVRAYLIIAGFFGLGGVGGAALGRAYTQRELAQVYGPEPQAREALFVQSVAAELGLNAEESRHLATIAAKYRTERRELTQQMYDTCGKPMQDLQTKMSAEVTAGFAPEKAARYLEVVAERRRLMGMAPR